MPNPVVSFEIRGPNPERLRKFYADVFGWDMFVFPGGGYTGIETAGAFARQRQRDGQVHRPGRSHERWRRYRQPRWPAGMEVQG